MSLIHRWIHRRALLAWLLLPWLALLLVAPGIILIDQVLGDGVTSQDWGLRQHRDWLWQGAIDLLLLLAGLYGAGSVVWVVGVLLGGRSARRAIVLLGLLCGWGGLMLGGLIGLDWSHPASLVMGIVALIVGGFYAALTHRPTPRVLRRVARPVDPLPDPMPPPPPPLRVPSPPPVPTLMRHEAPTTLPADY